MSSFTLSIENFEGPIDLLLQMIEKRKMPINDISLALIAEEYLSFLQNLDEISLNEKTHFIFVASTLTLIKSKSLLPALDLSSEEEGDIELLKKRLELLKIYRGLSLELKETIKPVQTFYFAQMRKKEISFSPPVSLEKEELLDLLNKLLQSIPENLPTKKEASLKIIIHIEDIMKSLIKRVSGAHTLSFNEFVSSFLTEQKHSPEEEQSYYIVGFLAILELAKKGEVGVEQENNFSPISINSL